MNELDLIRDFIKKQFILHDVPSGFHDFIVIGENKVKFSYIGNGLGKNYISLVSIKHFQYDLILGLYKHIIIVTESENTITITVNPGFEWLSKYDIESKDIDKYKLIDQLLSHKLYANDNVQLTFDLLCTNNSEYYSQLYTKDWTSGQNLEYDNDEIIKFLLPYSKVEYDHLLASISENILILLLNSIELTDPNKNYELLDMYICKGNYNIVSKIYQKCKVLKDWGLLISVVRSGNFEMFKLLSGDTNLSFDLVLDTSIEYSNIDVIKYIIKNKSYLITDQHLILCKNLGRYKEYNLLLKE